MAQLDHPTSERCTMTDSDSRTTTRKPSRVRLRRDWRPRHVLKIGHTSGDAYCHAHGRNTPWPCTQTRLLDRLIVWLGGRSR